MPIPFVCPDCGAKGNAPDRLAGQWLKCPKCATQFTPNAPPPAAAPPVDDDMVVPSVRRRRQQGSGVGVLVVVGVVLGAIAAVGLAVIFLAPVQGPSISVEDRSALEDLKQAQWEKSSRLPGDKRAAGVRALGYRIQERLVSAEVRSQLIRFLKEAEKESDPDVSEAATEALRSAPQRSK